ncbi:HlyD family efflux transporter periplasmic adaptor subunit [Ilyomonas limi]|uniref:HlyD family efflux transporter periplasmic adaptor subunit n=1 Tax=Ilyomonas limi TaxID=2575867 RepID=A0A4U3L1A7_9BACT|nr:efflux RND transporter periplasmic adaptor subunit [Ilyomonas limi]TKK67999.1 HlyD family efflux transporter periplasmic adaptor subunit [Ilyomonas limi]
MNKYVSLVTIFLLACIMQSCKNATADDSGEESSPEDIVTPVTITHPMHENISETVEVNAVSSFLLKTYVKANAVGYLQSANAHIGQYVSKGQTLFTIKTKEAEALGNTINSIDTSLHFEGIVRVKAPGSGYITQLTYTAGNYVQDGEQLAEISDNNSFAFLLDLPYELKPYLSLNHAVQLRLPDSTVLQGYIQSALPTVDSIAQTQRLVVKVNTAKLVPENLVAKVNLVKAAKPFATILPKEAVLSNEEQTEFWIMQLMNDSIAIKLPVQKGIEKNDKVEIISPPLNDSARILLTGNYGLGDTAKVKMMR